MITRRFVIFVIAGALILASLAGCRMLGKTAPANVLRVGITPNYPPVIFERGGKIMGLEIDMAQELARALNRPLSIIDVKWTDQIDVLFDGETDIIMSGMTITDARKVRIAFAEPYIRVGLMALVRRQDAKKFATPEKILQSDLIGVDKGSSGDVFAHAKCSNPGGITYVEAPDAPYYLLNRRIDVFIFDGPACIWMASENEGGLVAIRKRLNDEYLAWAVRKNDPQLLEEVNRVLEGWKKDGTLHRLIKPWIPDYQLFQ